MTHFETAMNVASETQMSESLFLSLLDQMFERDELTKAECRQVKYAYQNRAR